MKILHVVHGWLPRHAGGTERYAARLVAAQKSAGHDVEVVIGSDTARDAARVERRDWEGIPLHVIGRSGLYLESWYRSWSPDAEGLFRELLEEVGPDVVHIHHWQRLTRTLVETCVRSGFPSVVTLHDVNATCPRTFRMRDGAFCAADVSAESCGDCVERFWFQNDEEIGRLIELYRDDYRHELHCANAVLAPSRALADLVIGHVPEMDGRIDVEPHGRVTPEFERERVPAENGELRLATWGAINPMKGSKLLVEAMAECRADERFHARLDIWGKGDEDFITELKARVPEDVVSFRGPFEPRELPLERYDAAVFPSLCFESWSFTVDEAFAAGLPVILPDRGGPTERAKDAGVTFASADAGALAQAISHLARHRGLIPGMRRAIPAFVSMDDHVEKLVQHYRRAAEEGAATSRLDRGRRRQRERLLAFQNQRRDERLYELRGRVDQERDRAEGLEREVEGREASVAEQRGVLDKYAVNLADLTGTLKERNEESNRLHGELTEKSTELARIHAELAERNAECQRLHGELAESVAECRKLHGQLAEVQRENGKSMDLSERTLAELRDELEEERAGSRTLQETLEDRQQRLDEFATSTLELRQRLTAAEEAERAASDAEKALREARDRMLAALDVEVDEPDPVAAFFVRLQPLMREGERVAALERTVARLETVRGNLKDEVGRFSLDVQQRNEALAVAVEEVQRAETMLEHLDVRISDDLRGIAEENAGHDLSAAGVDAVLDHAIANHHRLHGLIRDRDELLDALIERVDAMERDQDRRSRQRRANGPQSAPTAGKFRRKLDSILSRKRAKRSGRKRLLIVVHDFLPKHNAGTEIYTYKLAKELQQTLDVHLLFCEARHEQERYTVSEGEFDGIPYTEVVHNYKWENFEETYHDPEMERIFIDVLDDYEPDLVHIQHLHYFSFEFIPIAKSRGLPVVYTLHEFMLMCARGGQLLREDMEICEKPVPEKCADCIRHHRLSGDYGQHDQHGRMGRVAGQLPDGLRRVLEGVAGPVIPAELDDEGRRVFAAAAGARLDFIGERAKMVDLFISPSGFLRQKFIDVGMIDADRIIHSDNGFDVTPFSGFERRPSDVLRFGFVGTIAPYKGIHVLVDAFEEIQDDGVELQVWGDLDTFIEYKQELLPRATNPRTKFMGRFENGRIAEVLGGIDVLIVPSLWFENSPLTIHEAWLARMPVIASDRGGMAELVDDGVNGFHFKLGDAVDLREKIRRFIADRSLVQAFGERPGEVKTIADNAVEILGHYERLLPGVTGG